MSSASSPRRVAITGIGLISPLGNSKESLWEALCAKQSGVRPTDLFGETTSVPQFAGEATEFTGHIREFGELEKDQKKMIRKGLKLMCRETTMGVAAIQGALQDAGLAPGDYDPERTGCVFGSDYMMTLPEDFVSGMAKCADNGGQFEFDRWAKEGMPLVTPLWLLMYLPNMPASHAAIYNDFRGPSNSLTVREASGNISIGEACNIILRGSADRMIAGSTGTRIHPMKAVHSVQQEEIASNGTDPAKAARPFDSDRGGMVLGEGAGAVMLEEFSVAQERGATIYGEIVGSASSSVNKDGIADRQQAMTNVLRGVLQSAQMSRSDVGHLHAHGLSTRSGDAEEARAIAEVFGSPDQQCPVVAAKSYFGNLGAGSGVVELISSLMALKNDRLFEILNYETPDADCPVRAVTSGEESPGSSVLNLSVTPQGQASALLVQACG